MPRLVDHRLRQRLLDPGLIAGLVLGVGLLVPVPALGAGLAAPQVSVEPATGTTLEVRPLGGELIELVARWGPLTIRQTVTRSGRTTLELRSGRDRTLLVVAPEGVQLHAGGGRVQLPATAASAADYATARALLARAAPMRHFRRFRARLEAATDPDPVTLGLLSATAALGLLDGDEGAPGRLARRLAAAHRARLRPAAMLPNCYLEYESSVYDAWIDLELCYYQTSPIYHTMCEWRWLLWVESSWFSFLSCSWGF